MKTLFLDIDGVLADFVTHSLAAHSKSMPFREITWDFYKQFQMTEADFYAPLGFDFWDSLPWMRQGRELLRAVEAIFGDNIALATSPLRTPGCVEGKVSWIKREMPRYKSRFFVGSAKHLLAGTDKVLVDDSDDNVTKFAAAGGLARLVPRPWNARRNEVKDDGTFDLHKLVDDIASF